MTNTYRNHSIYLREDHHAQPKERDKVLVDLIADHVGSLSEHARVLDVGCATGALLGVLAQSFPDYSFTGLDVFPDLLEKAREMVPAARFETGSALNLSAFAGQFDIVLCTGVLGIFDEVDAQRVMEGLVAAARPGGLVYVLANFNDANADVVMRYRKWRDADLGQWETGWNIYSRRTVGQWLEGRARRHRFIPFEMPFPIDRTDDPSRTYTIRDDEGNLLLVNGLRILASLTYLEVEV